MSVPQLLPMNNMLSEAIIRPAGSKDSEAIAALMREGVSEQVRRITILGSPYLARFIADELTRNKNDEYVVCTVREQVVGMCAWRHTDTALHLNHLYLAQNVRGQGLGTALLLDELSRIRRASQHKLSTDVFFDTPRAQAWYRSLSMRSEKHAHWIQVSLPRSISNGERRCTISGVEEAAADHLRYGFSHFVLTTDSSSYQVGRLGPDLFRIGTFAILQDPTALQGLARFDAERQLVCSGPAGDCAALSPGTNAVVAESERLVSSCATVMEHLESSLPRRRHSFQSISVRI
jgi:ribosomal protein S18 acetylase RimI-like enzyme